MSQAAHAQELGYSKGYITLPRRQGRALVMHEVPARSPLFATLIKAAERKEVAALLDRQEAVPHEVLAAVAAGSGGGSAVEDLVNKVRQVLPDARASDLLIWEDKLTHLLADLQTSRASRPARG